MNKILGLFARQKPNDTLPSQKSGDDDVVNEGEMTEDYDDAATAAGGQEEDTDDENLSHDTSRQEETGMIAGF